MTTRQLEQIIELRQLNYSYRFIGDKLGLSTNTVKSICRRKEITPTGARKTKAEKQSARFCSSCGAILPQDGNPAQKFCSGRGRKKHWKSHRRVIEKQT